MNQINKDKSVFERLDHKKRSKSELLFYKLLAKQKAKANPFGVVRSEETLPTKEIKPGADTND